MIHKLSYPWQYLINILFKIAESVPVEILSRGKEAVEAFMKARSAGTLRIYRGKLILLGQDG